MTQCAIEERRSLQLAMLGLTTYAETLSVYGTEPVFVDGDDTPWSKAFLALGLCLARRQGALHLRHRLRGADGPRRGLLDALPRGALPGGRSARPGSQGVQNGSISCVALCPSVPGGTREILAENLLAAWLDLEVASGNDAIASHSPIAHARPS